MHQLGKHNHIIHLSICQWKSNISSKLQTLRYHFTWQDLINKSACQDLLEWMLMPHPVMALRLRLVPRFHI